LHEGTVTAEPRTQVIIKRPRLTKILDDSRARLLLLVAPAGYGKTTLAREWTEGKERVGWYSGGPGMMDVAGLSVGIAEVLASMGEPAREDMVERVRILAAHGHTPRGLAKAVSACAPEADWLLVVDDYHHAIGSEESEDFFEELVGQTAFRLLITSRERPRWIRGRNVVYGQAVVVDTSTLAFTDDEAGAILGGSPGKLLADAKGWPAVIGLAALRGLDGTGGADSLPPEELYRFFAEDLFIASSEKLQGALYLLALVGGVGQESLGALLGSDHAALVQQAEDRGFLSSGSSRVVHPLLRAFLFAKLRERGDEESRSAAAESVNYLADCHRWDDCLSVLVHFPDKPLFLSSFQRMLEDIVYSRVVLGVTGWLELAKTLGVSHPLIFFAEADVAFRSGNTIQARGLAERAATRLEGDWRARALLLAARAAHMDGDEASSTSLCERILASSSAAAVTKRDALWVVFGSRSEFDCADSDRLLRRLEEFPQNDPTHELRLICARGFLSVRFGRVREGMPVLEMAMSRLPQIRDPLARTNAIHFLAFSYLMSGRYEDSARASQWLIDEARSTDLAFAVDYGLLRLFGAHVGARKVGLAQRVYAELERRPRSSLGFVAENIRLQRVKLPIAVGDLSRAETLLEGRFPGIERANLGGELAGYRALVAAARGNRQRALQLLSINEACFNQVEPRSLRQVTLAILASQERNGAQRCNRVLLDLLTAGCADPVVTGLRAYPPLLEVAARDSELRAELVDVVAHSRDFDLARSVGLKIPRELRPRAKLSSREQEVYELLAEGRTNTEIAGQLYISLSTTKVHVRHIFEKLGVRSRAEAAHLAGIDGLF